MISLEKEHGHTHKKILLFASLKKKKKASGDYGRLRCMRSEEAFAYIFI